MKPVFRFEPGESPLLISVPHDGREIPVQIRERMTSTGRSVPDTDWHVAELYDFATGIDANMLVANYSRYVVDLNRSAEDDPLYPGQVSTGLCPERTFAGEAIYRDGSVSNEQKRGRVRDYWQPYHEQIQTTLDALRETYGFALLWDAHSIPGRVPRLFKGELPALNLGSNSGASCAKDREDAVASVAMASSHSAVVNERFKGGYITRHYGDPERHVHALQLEIAQRAYMDEDTLALKEHKVAVLRGTLQKMLAAYREASCK